MSSSPTINISADEAYSGVYQMIGEHAEPADILDDLEESQDHVDLLDADENQSLGDTRSTFDFAELKASVNEVSKGVSEKTAAEYERLMKQCETFVHKHHMVPEGTKFFSEKPHSQAAEFLVAWIMNSCDEINLDGTEKDISTERSTYTHAQKMRASATFGFGRVYGLGMAIWHRSEVSGKMQGNPSVSETVTSYMLSLRRRKTKKGETPTSARAVSSDLLSRLYHFNNQAQFREQNKTEPTARNVPKDPMNWAGPRARAQMNLGYTLAFSGLLRVDELLKIQIHDLTVEEDPKTGKIKVYLNLPFRKTSQFGDIKPFVWWELPEEYAHLCIPRAYARWIKITRLTNGYLFRKIRANDRIAEENEPMTSEQFLEMFRNNLLDVGVDHIPYGTHSFRRGGCQWLATELRWSLRQICEWGGWSVEFTNLTIVKYLISWNDNPTMSRDDFFNFDREPATVCPTCNRSCHCA